MNELITENDQTIQDIIYSIRDLQVMLDKDLAELYGVETKHINQAVKNNKDKFQEDFFFELTDDEFDNLRSNHLTAKFAKTRVNPKVFTEHGVYMLATILKSKTASQTTVLIIRTFASMRKFLLSNASIFQRLDTLENKQLQSKLDADDKFNTIFKAMEEKDLPKKQHIFYNGQIFDAYIFINNIIKSAKKSIILIDNYIDETVLLQLSSDAQQNVKITILTKTISKKLELDIKKHNAQYKTIEIKKFALSHDRFLIIDEKEIYHIGASLKDLGKKWFAFSLMDEESIGFMKKIREVVK